MIEFIIPYTTRENERKVAAQQAEVYSATCTAISEDYKGKFFCLNKHMIDSAKQANSHHCSNSTKENSVKFSSLKPFSHQLTSFTF